MNETFLAALGAPDLSARPTVVIGGPTPVQATVVGVVRAGYGDEKLAYRVDRSTGPRDTVASADPMMFGPTTLVTVRRGSGRSVSSAASGRRPAGSSRR